MSIHDIINAWNGFFFEPIPVHAIALFRIVLGGILLYDAFFIYRNLNAYLGPKGLQRFNSFIRQSCARHFSMFFYLPRTMRSVHLVMGIHTAAVILLMVGLFTPIATVVTFITLRSIISRNVHAVNGGDTVATIMLFFLIFAPSGRIWSLDEFFFYGGSAQSGEHVSFEPWAMRLMQIQLSVIYIYTAYWKLRGETYRNGTALYYVMNNNIYRRFDLPNFLLRTPWIQAMTWGVLFFEFFLGAFIWIEEFRIWLVILGIAFHLGIELTMNVHLFGWYMIASLLLFVDPSEIASFF